MDGSLGNALNVTVASQKNKEHEIGSRASIQLSVMMEGTHSLLEEKKMEWETPSAMTPVAMAAVVATTAWLDGDGSMPEGPVAAVVCG